MRVIIRKRGRSTFEGVFPLKTILNREENELVWQLYEVTYTFVGDRQALEAEIAKRTGKDPASVSTMASALIEIFDGCD